MSFVTDFYRAPSGSVRWKQRQQQPYSRRHLEVTAPRHDAFDQRLVERNEFIGSAIVVNDEVEYATRQIDGIEQYVSLGADICGRLLVALRASLLAQSVFPTITTDGGDGLIAQWKAGPRYLMLEVSSDGGYSLMATGDDGHLQVNMADDGGPDLEHLKLLVREFSAFVIQRNPAWRDQ